MAPPGVDTCCIIRIYVEPNSGRAYGETGEGPVTGRQELIQEKRRGSLAGPGRTPFGLKARIRERVLKEAAPLREMEGA